MEYVQERVATIHDFGGATPAVPNDQAAIVVPVTEREHASLAAERVFGILGDLSPGCVVVPLRAAPENVPEIASWLEAQPVDVDIVWCDGERVEAILDENGLDGARGKGRDVWLGLAHAVQHRYVVFHDSDADSYDATTVPRLLFPLANGYEFSKGYYARVEQNRLYGRLNRLLLEPLLVALEDEVDHDIVEYLGAFRYGLAGEFAVTRSLARRLRPEKTWGLEVCTLGDAFQHAGFAGSAQVDLGVYEHDHRAVTGPGGLESMSDTVAAALFHVLDDFSVRPDFESLRTRYLDVARSFIDGYALDAAFNGLEYDRANELDQVEAYASSVAAPLPDERLPPWEDAPISPSAVREAVAADLADARRHG